MESGILLTKLREACRCPGCNFGVFRSSFLAMTNEQATELLALMADQIKATDRLSETFEKRFTQLNETMLSGFVRLEDKFDKKTDILADEIRGTNRRVDTLTDRVGTLTEEVRDMKTEAQVTNRRLQATFEHTGFLTEENTTKEIRLVAARNFQR